MADGVGFKPTDGVSRHLVSIRAATKQVATTPLLKAHWSRDEGKVFVAKEKGVICGEAWDLV